MPIHFAQLLTYMELERVSSGLLINFNVQTLFHGIRRVLPDLAAPCCLRVFLVSVVNSCASESGRPMLKP